MGLQAILFGIPKENISLPLDGVAKRVPIGIGLRYRFPICVNQNFFCFHFLFCHYLFLILPLAPILVFVKPGSCKRRPNSSSFQWMKGLSKPRLNSTFAYAPRVLRLPSLYPAKSFSSEGLLFRPPS